MHQIFAFIFHHKFNGHYPQAKIGQVFLFLASILSLTIPAREITLLFSTDPYFRHLITFTISTWNVFLSLFFFPSRTDIYFQGYFFNSRKHDDATLTFIYLFSGRRGKIGGNGRRWCLREDVKKLNEKKKFTFEESIQMKVTFLLPVFFGKRKWIQRSKLCFIINNY